MNINGIIGSLYSGYSSLFHGIQNWMSTSIPEVQIVNGELSEVSHKPIEKVTASELGEWVEGVADYSIKRRDQHYLNTNWKLARDLYNGEWWAENNLDEWRSKIVANYVKEHVRLRAAYVTANPMVPAAFPVESSDSTTADFVSDIVQGVFYLNNFNGSLDFDMRVEADTTGTSYAKAEWDDELNPPYGDIRLKVVSADKVITDWDAEDLQQGRWFGEVYFKTEEELRAMTTTNKFNKIVETPGKEVQNQKTRYRVIELYVWDRSERNKTTTTIEITPGMTGTDEMGNPISGLVHEEVESKEAIANYPNGRRIVVCNSVVIEDEQVNAKMVQNSVRFPYAVAKGNRQPHEQYGTSVVLEEAPIVAELIKSIADVTDVFRLFAYPVVRAPKGAFKNIEREAMYGPNIVWEYNPKPNVAAPDLHTPPPGILANGTQHINLVTNIYENLTGFNSVAMGAAPGGVQSGRGILALGQRADIRAAPMMKEHATTLKTLGKIILAYVQEGYTEKRIIRRAGERGNLIKTEINGGLTGLLNNPGLFNFDINFDVVSAQPTNFMARSQENVQLAQVGLIDRLTALERSDIPNKDKVVRRWVQLGMLPASVAVNEGYMSPDDPAIQQQQGMQIAPPVGIPSSGPNTPQPVASNAPQAGPGAEQEAQLTPKELSGTV